MTADAGTDEPDELLVARAVSNVSRWGMGRELGEPVLNDDGSAEGMFDIRFDDSEPPVAMEVTSVVDSDFIATANAADPVADELTAYATTLGFGRWHIMVTAGTRLRPIVQDLKDLMATGLPNGSPVRDGLPPGVNAVYLEPDGPSVAAIGTWSHAGAVALSDLSRDLELAIDDNSEKLAAAAGYEKHLAVDIKALRATDPGRTPAPRLPTAIDWLWVVRRRVTEGRSTPVVWVTGRSGGWRVNGEPWE